MVQEISWSSVENYFVQHLLAGDPPLSGALSANSAAGLPAIDVAPTEGKMLHLMARMTGARRILELGTLGGYSAIWLARALPDEGRLITVELSSEHAEVAQGNIERSGMASKVEIRVGPALDVLPTLVEEQPFDFFFIDADKANIHNYFEWALKLSRPGSVIVVDNVVRNGAVVDADTQDANIQGVRRLIEMLAKDSRVSATALQTVGSKGYDGFLVAVVN